MDLTFKWTVTTNYIGGVPLYRVYRNLRKNEPDHSGNREYRNISFAKRKAARDYADYLNKEEEKLGL